MSKLLFLDDYREPIDCAKYMYRKGVDCKIYHEQWNIVRSYGQFVKWITENGLPEFISFDHDLGDVEELKEDLPVEEWFDLENNREYNGMDCAKWLVEYCMDNKLQLPKYAVHSANPAGTENIEGLFLSFLKSQQVKNVIEIVSPKGIKTTYLNLPEKHLQTKSLFQLQHKMRVKQILFGGAFTYYHTEMDFTNAVNAGFKITTDNRK